MTNVHARFAVSVILYMAIVAAWGIVSYFRKTGMSGSYRGTLVIGELMLVAQGVFGLLLVGNGYRPAQSLHFLYGGLSLFVLPVLVTYARFRPKNQVPLVYGLGALFITGLAIRALMTGA